MKNKLNFGRQLTTGLPLRTRLQVGIFKDADAYINAFKSFMGNDYENKCKYNISDYCSAKRWEFYYKNVPDCNGNRDCSAVYEKGSNAIYDYWTLGQYYPIWD